MIFQLHAKISFKLEFSNIKGGNPDPLLHWDNVDAVIDFQNRKISCEIEEYSEFVLPLSFCSDCAVKITALSVSYNNLTYEAEAGKIECAISGDDGVYNCPHVSFLLFNAVIPLIPRDEEHKNYLVFSGANRDEFQMSVEYKGQPFHFQSPKDSDLLTVFSDREISSDNRRLITLAYSLFQNGEIAILESHSASEFQLYIQLPPPAGTRLCKDKDIFLLIWNWLTRNDAFKSQRNILDFFLAGARSYGSYLDFRIINLFICMNSICGQDGHGKFGENISKNFDIPKADGLWLAYIRNSMVHAGKSILEAIDDAFSEFNRKQAPHGVKVERYAAYAATPDKGKLPSALYYDMIDLLMAYFMKTIGYDKPIETMHHIFGVSV